MTNRKVVIVSPALATANNGNWQTARRWQRLLSASCTARIVQHWPDGPGAVYDEVMLALHARRSEAAIAAWSQTRGSRGLVVVLTGTDLYHDLAVDPVVRQSLDRAQTLVVLQDQAPRALPADLRHKAQVIVQSVPVRQAVPKTRRHLRAVMVGHLREEKDPLTLLAAARLMGAESGIYIDHIGAPLDSALGEAAQATAAQCQHYRWLGAQAHDTTLRRIQRAHLLVHTSRLEGGAHVVMEAVRSGTAVLASRMDGNVGMLGLDYAGYFDVGDAAGLAALLRKCRADLDAPLSDNGTLLQILQHQCAQRAPLFATEQEQAALRALIGGLFNSY
jgi:putative glycosyltransferase (TIGR04348 family)